MPLIGFIFDPVRTPADGPVQDADLLLLVCAGPEMFCFYFIFVLHLYLEPHQRIFWTSDGEVITMYR